MIRHLAVILLMQTLDFGHGLKAEVAMLLDS